MASIDLKILHASFGCGGVRCCCCRPGKPTARKRISRAAKRRARREANREIARST